MRIPESPSPPEEQIARLTPALDLEEAGIPTIVYAEDALSFIHHVPTYLFDQQLLVSEKNIHSAVQVLCEKYGFTILDLTSDELYRDYIIHNPEQPCAFLGLPSTLLGRKLGTHYQDGDPYAQLPDRILIHAANTYHMDINDPSRFCFNHHPPLPKFASIRFPTLPAFYDSLIDTYLEPPLPFLHYKLKSRIRCYIGYLDYYTVARKGRTKLESPKHPERLGLTLKCLTALDGIKDENKPFLTRRLKDMPAFGHAVDALERLMIKEAR